jgi:ABC-type multidrug transport system fused ATPase/permease subunit
MKLDTNKAWGEAAALVSANRDVLWALAGVFFVLPAFAFSVFYPEPEIPPGAKPQELFALFEAAYAGALPAILLSMALQIVGTLTVLTLFSDRSRPTVGQAIKLGASGLPTYFGANLILGFAMSLIGVLMIGIATASGSAGVIVLLAFAAGIALVYFGVRLGLLGPVIAVEGQRNPLAAIQRSWALTKGNVGRILLFFVLLGLAFAIVIGLIMLVFGVVLALVLGGEGARIGAALLSALFSAAAQLYFIAVLAAIHRQLAGPSAEVIAEPFS